MLASKPKKLMRSLGPTGWKKRTQSFKFSPDSLEFGEGKKIPGRSGRRRGGLSLREAKRRQLLSKFASLHGMLALREQCERALKLVQLLGLRLLARLAFTSEQR